MTCKTCKYWTGERVDSVKNRLRCGENVMEWDSLSLGECRINPPIVSLRGNGRDFPTTDSKDFCGKHETIFNKSMSLDGERNEWTEYKCKLCDCVFATEFEIESHACKFHQQGSH